MSFPPALTWLELLPNRASCTCESGPESFRALVAKHRSAGRESGGDSAAVAVNDAGAVARLEKSGFAYIRRLAVLPSLENPRWFVPLDAGGAAAAAGLSLYTPARRS